MTRAQKLKLFNDSAEQAGLKKDTITKLVAQDLDSMDVLRLVSNDDIGHLELSRGQTLLLTELVKDLKLQRLQTVSEGQVSVIAGPSAANTSVHEGPTTADAPNTRTLARDSELKTLLKELKGQRTDDLFADPESQDDTPRHTGRPLLIPDFVNRVTHGSSDDLEREVCTQGGAQLVLRATRQKPLPEQVSLAQWIGANARIMAQLINDGRLSSTNDILDYLDYTAIFSDYAQVNEVESLMLYDHEFRKKQFRKSRSWGEDDLHLSNFYLQRRREVSRKPEKQRPSDRPARVVDQQGFEVCRNYNNFGCYREYCRYSHVCAICKDKSHTKAYHRNAAITQPAAPSIAQPATVAQGNSTSFHQQRPQRF